MDDFVARYLAELFQCLSELERSVLFQMVEVLKKVYNERRKVFVFGNGGSAATASHLALHLRQAGKSEKALNVSCLADNVPLVTAIANDDSYSAIFKAQLEGAVYPGDVVIAISGSGDSANVLEAVHYARERDAIVLALVGFGGGKLASLAHHRIVFSSRNYGPVEDAHLSLVHLVCRLLQKAVADV